MEILGEKRTLTHISCVSLGKLLTFLSLSFFILNIYVILSILQGYWYKKLVLIQTFNLEWLSLLCHCCCHCWIQQEETWYIWVLASLPFPFLQEGLCKDFLQKYLHFLLNLILRMNTSFLRKWLPHHPTQGCPATQSKPSCTHLVKLLTPGRTLLNLPVNSTVHHFIATSVTTMMPKFLLLHHGHPLPLTEGNSELLMESELLSSPGSLPTPMIQSLRGSSAKAWFYLPLVDSFSASQGYFLIYTVFLHALADDLDSVFYWQGQGHSKPTDYKALTGNSRNCLAFIPTNHLVWL